MRKSEIRAQASGYVDFRMQEWGMGEQSGRMQTCVHRVLKELQVTALIMLKDQRFEVLVLPNSWGQGFCYPYFPIYPQRRIVKHVTSLGMPPKPETRVLLILTSPAFETEPMKFLADCLRDALGHVLLYLRSPKASNHCPDAMKEWRANTAA